MHPSPHFYCHNLSLFVSTILSRNSQLPFGISHRIDNGHELFFLSPLISFQLKVLPDKVVNLHKVVSSHDIL